MSRLAITASLAELEQSDSRPKAVQFREIHEEVERAIAAGATYTQIIEAINKSSKLDLNANTFRGYLDRARKRKSKVPKRAVILEEALREASTTPTHAAAPPSIPVARSSTSVPPLGIDSSNKERPPIDFRAARNAPVDLQKLQAAAKAAQKATK